MSCHDLCVSDNKVMQRNRVSRFLVTARSTASQCGSSTTSIRSSSTQPDSRNLPTSTSLCSGTPTRAKQCTSSPSTSRLHKTVAKHRAFSTKSSSSRLRESSSSILRLLQSEALLLHFHIIYDPRTCTQCLFLILFGYVIRRFYDRVVLLQPFEIVHMKEA